MWESGAFRGEYSAVGNFTTEDTESTRWKKKTAEWESSEAQDEAEALGA